MSYSSIIAKAKERFRKEFTYGVLLSASSDLSAGEDIRLSRDWHPDKITDFLEQEILTALSEQKRGIEEKVEGMKTKYTGQNDSIEVGKILVLNKVIRLLSEEVHGEGRE